MKLTLASPSIWMFSQSIDFRCSIKGLTTLVHSKFALNPCDAIFIFYNRRRDKLKVLAWHGNGFAMIYKCLEKGKFTVPTSGCHRVNLDNKQLSWLLAGLDWVQMSSWSELSYDNFS